MTQFAKIGSMDKAKSGSFVSRPVVFSRSGPYDSTIKFYDEYPRGLAKALGTRGSPTDGQDELLQLYRALAPSCRKKDSPARGWEGFGLPNFEVGPNSILVGRDFNVLAVL